MPSHKCITLRSQKLAVVYRCVMSTRAQWDSQRCKTCHVGPVWRNCSCNAVVPQITAITLAHSVSAAAVVVLQLGDQHMKVMSKILCSCKQSDLDTLLTAVYETADSRDLIEQAVSEKRDA